MSNTPPPFIKGTGLNNFYSADSNINEILNATYDYNSNDPGNADLGWYGGSALMWYWNTSEYTDVAKIAQLWHKAVSNQASYKAWKAAPGSNPDVDAHYTNLAAALSQGYQQAKSGSVYISPSVLQAYILAREGASSSTYTNFLKMLADPNGYEVASVLTTNFLVTQNYDKTKDQINKLNPAQWATMAKGLPGFPHGNQPTIGGMSWDSQNNMVVFSGSQGYVYVKKKGGGSGGSGGGGYKPSTGFPYLLVGGVAVVLLFGFIAWREA